jgi:Na+-transporting NADH:ubiquinone oxidoreductase subunit NqrB
MNLATKIPVKIRQTIYTVLAALIAVEAVWDVVDGALESKILATLSVLGFGVALGNTVTKAD